MTFDPILIEFPIYLSVNIIWKWHISNNLRECRNRILRGDSALLRSSRVLSFDHRSQRLQTAQNLVSIIVDMLISDSHHTESISSRLSHFRILVTQQLVHNRNEFRETSWQVSDTVLDGVIEKTHSPLSLEVLFGSLDELNSTIEHVDHSLEDALLELFHQRVSQIGDCSKARRLQLHEVIQLLLSLSIVVILVFSWTIVHSLSVILELFQQNRDDEFHLLFGDSLSLHNLNTRSDGGHERGENLDVILLFH
ncbi:hypothetical protein GCK72_003218 [Caenorhabditis remanei]|uniref:Uncharacterized protein n=1 Tax=Caenorhabditis remanei TaxID=31234 RepID=A0A6A5HYM2_CAERE|nr:hypothetical protein GCK72_003218 [Caenorhabditis remanei]KAF1771392.1 hypothetical protein GCK72_003218 [Caenorhabditis remanei]